jgi:hypothetical protein
MRYFTLLILAFTLAANAQPFSLRDPAFLGAVKPKVSAPAGAALLNGLLAYWKADESSGDISDSSGNGNTMAALPAFTVDTSDPENPITNYVGVIDYSTNGIINTGIGFHDDRSKFQAASSVLPAGDFSLSFWVNSISTIETNPTARIYDTEDSGVAIAMHFPISAGQIGIYAAGYGVYGSSTIGLNDGLWHNIIVIKNSGNLSLYIDGLLDTNFGATGAFGQGLDTIGGYAAGNAQGIDGIVDEVGVWNRALNTDEIADIAAATPYGLFTN